MTMRIPFGTVCMGCLYGSIFQEYPGTLSGICENRIGDGIIFAQFRRLYFRSVFFL